MAIVDAAYGTGQHPNGCGKNKSKRTLHHITEATKRQLKTDSKKSSAIIKGRRTAEAVAVHTPTKAQQIQSEQRKKKEKNKKNKKWFAARHKM